METYSIKDLFEFISEKNITESCIYNHTGEYPIYTGQTTSDDALFHINTYQLEGDYLTVTTYGSSGRMIYRNGKGTIGRNCMGLKLRPEKEEKVNLKWFSFKYQNLFYRLRVGDPNGQMSLNKLLIEDIKVEIPNINTQKQELLLYEQAETMLGQTMLFIRKLENLLNTTIVYPSEDEPSYSSEYIGNIFKIKGGNSGLTKEYIYANQPTNKEDMINVYSGSTEKSKAIGSVSKKVPIKIEKGPAIIVVRKGRAGWMQIIQDEYFAINDDAYVLELKKEWVDRIDLKWFVNQYQPLFFDTVTSKSDNATFSKNVIEKQLIKIYDWNIQSEIGSKLKKIHETINYLLILENNIRELIQHEIT